MSDWALDVKPDKCDSMFRSMLVAILVFFCCGDIMYAQEGSTQWNEGLAAYRAEQWATAIDKWSSLAEREPSAALMYNLGNAHYQAGDIARSIWAYERALRLDPGHQSAADNLTIVRAAIEDPVTEVAPFFLKRWWDEWYSSMPANAWAIAFLISLILLSLAGIARLRNWMGSRRSGYAIFFSFLLTLLTGFSAHASYKHFTSQTEAIVLGARVNLHLSPDESSPVVRGFPGGTRVRIIDTLTGWYEVILPNLERGWVDGELLEPF
jgi:tetratricopeptide (TPR) repeat protein